MSQETPTDLLPTHPAVEIWRFWLTHLLGWTEAQVLGFAERWRDQIFDEGSMFYHEVAEYYISYQLVPAEIREAYTTGLTACNIAWAIYPTLERYKQAYGLTTDHLDDLRAELKQAISRRLGELTTSRDQTG